MAKFHFSLAHHFPAEIITSATSGGPTTEKQALIPDQAGLHEFFEGTPPEIHIDFTKGFVFAIALGERPTGGFSINVNDISQYTNGILAGAVTISYEEVTPNGPTTDQITTPYVLFYAIGLQYSTHVFFRKESPQTMQLNVIGTGTKFIVIALTGTNTGCQILPEDAIYTAIHTQVFGPASHSECELYVANSCES